MWLLRYFIFPIVKSAQDICGSVIPAKPRIKLEKVQSQHPKKNSRRNKLLGHSLPERRDRKSEGKRKTTKKKIKKKLKIENCVTEIIISTKKVNLISVILSGALNYQQVRKTYCLFD